MTPLRIACVIIANVFVTHVYSSGEKFKAVLLRMSQLASSGATELRVRSLDAISQLLTLQVQKKYSLPFFLSLNAIFNLKKLKLY